MRFGSSLAISCVSLKKHMFLTRKILVFFGFSRDSVHTLEYSHDLMPKKSTPHVRFAIAELIGDDACSIMCSNTESGRQHCFLVLGSLFL